MSLPLEVKICMGDFDKFHGQYLDFYIQSWNENDPYEKKILELKYEQYREKAFVALEKMNKYMVLHMKEKYGDV